MLYVCWTVLHKSWRVAQVLRFGQSVGGLVEHKEFVLSSRFANSKLLLLFLLPLPASTKHNSKRDAEQRRGKPSRRPCCSPWLGCKINCPQFSPPLAVWSIFFLSEFKNEVMRNGSLMQQKAIYILTWYICIACKLLISWISWRPEYI